MKHFIGFQLFLYISAAGLLSLSILVDPSRISGYLYMTFLLSALIIGPVQYLSAIVLLITGSPKKAALCLYLLVASAIVAVLVYFNIDSPGSFYLVGAGHITGLAYLRLCYSIQRQPPLQIREKEGVL